MHDAAGGAAGSQEPAALMGGGGWSPSAYEIMSHNGSRNTNAFFGIPISQGRPGDDVDDWTLPELRKFSDVLYKNSGFVRRLFHGTCRYTVGDP